MTTNRAFGIVLGLVMGASPLAFADNVIVGSQPAAPAQATTQPAPVVVQPSQTTVQPAQPVIDEPSHRSVVRADVSPPHSYMGTIAGGAFLGAAAGALIGGAIYFLGDQNHPVNIAYWAAGGVLVGTGVGPDADHGAGEPRVAGDRHVAGSGADASPRALSDAVLGDGGGTERTGLLTLTLSSQTRRGDGVVIRGELCRESCRGAFFYQRLAPVAGESCGGEGSGAGTF